MCWEAATGLVRKQLAGMPEGGRRGATWTGRGLRTRPSSGSAWASRRDRAPPWRGRAGARGIFRGTADRGRAGDRNGRAGDRRPRPRDYFFNRVIFPIADRRGRVIAFGGRAMGESKPKYLNSPDTPLFHKGRVLYNLARARKAAHDTGEMLVAEGYMDVIALAQGGFPAAVAPWARP